MTSMWGAKATVLKTCLLLMTMTAPGLAQERFLIQGGGSTPRLGFWGHMHYGHGMVVDHVTPGSVAEELGLERGDTIVRINNRSIRTDQDYNQALRYSGGRVRLLVDDVNGNGMIWTTAYLNDGTGPSQPRWQRVEE